MKRNGTRLSGAFNAVLSLSGLVLLWFALTVWTGAVSAARFPTPYEFINATKQIVVQGYGNGKLHQHVIQSVILVTSSFLAASSVGVLVGMLMGVSRRIEALINPIFLTLRPIPPLAWIPLAIVWLGLGDSAKVMVIFVAAFVPSLINSYTAVRSIDRPIIEAGAMLGIKPLHYWTEILIPASLPLIFTGLRLSLQASWTTLVAAELIGALLGLGSILNQAAQDIYPAMILVGMVSVALSGWSMTVLLGLLERRVMPWRS